MDILMLHDFQLCIKYVYLEKASIAYKLNLSYSYNIRGQYTFACLIEGTFLSKLYFLAILVGGGGHLAKVYSLLCI